MLKDKITTVKQREWDNISKEIIYNPKEIIKEIENIVIQLH